MKSFSLVENPINNSETKQLCEIVKNHSTLNSLSIDSCVGPDITGYEMLQMVITAGKNKLQTLNMRDNSISTGGDTFISDFIRRDHFKLVSLNLTGNQLNDDDATNIAEALKGNKHLNTLNIRRNNFTSTGWEALSTAVFDKTSLNAAFHSNHTCTIDFPVSADVTDYVFVANINGFKYGCFRPFLWRHKKIYSILSDRNTWRSNVDHFDDDMPVELLPDMLTAIQKYSTYYVHPTSHNELPENDGWDVEPLLIMFEILQRWDKSLAVFEALSS